MEERAGGESWRRELEERSRGGKGRERGVNKSAWVWFDTTLI